MATQKSKTTIVEPAPLSVRFSAGIIDLGFVLVFIGAISVGWRLINDIPLGSVRYEPPRADDALPRMAKSLAIYVALSAYFAAWISSRLQATPGMMPVNTQVRDTHGRRVRFLRAMIWFLVAFAPLMLGNMIVLLGLSLEDSLIHLGRLNVFSFLILLQVIWFLMILAGPDKRTVHDMICGVHVDHTTRPFSHPVLKHIAFLPLSGVAILVLTGTMVIAGTNLVDSRLDDKIRQYENISPENAAGLWKSWKNDAPYEIEIETIDFSCAAHKQKFQRDFICPPETVIRTAIADHKMLIDQYYRDFGSPSLKTPVFRRYTYRESIQLTDLVLADMMFRFQAGGKDQRQEIFDQWIDIAERWNRILRTPDFLHVKTAVSMQFNHVLQVLPVFLDLQPDLISRQPGRIDDLLTPIIFDREFAEEILAFQYAVYNLHLKRSRIDFFPLIQPNALRNRFAELAGTMEAKLLSYRRYIRRGVVPGTDKTGSDGDVSNLIFTGTGTGTASPDRPSFLGGIVTALYNPLGRQIYDVINLEQSLQYVSLSAYGLNNAMKRMIAVILDIKRKDIADKDISGYLDTLPLELQYPFLDQKLRFNREGRYLYHSSPKMPSVRRIVPF